MSSSLIPLPNSGDEPSRNGLMEVERLAHHFIQSGYFKDLRNISQAVVKILKGRSLGIDDFTSCDQINMIQGKPAPNANLIAALIRKSGTYDYKIVELTDTVCAIRMFKNGEALEPVTRFTIEDAQRAGLSRNPTYKAYPSNMLFARCISNAARFHAPDVTTGLYVPEDFPESGTTVSAAPIPVTVTFPSPQAAPIPEGNNIVPKLLEETNTTLEQLNESLGTSFQSVDEIESEPFVISFLKSKREAKG